MTRINAARGNEDLLLKIGIHEGPCLAVTLNNRQDYFGQTVNMAARVQGLGVLARHLCHPAGGRGRQDRRKSSKARACSRRCSAPRCAASPTRPRSTRFPDCKWRPQSDIGWESDRGHARRSTKAHAQTGPAAVAAIRKNLSGLVGPVPSRFPRAGLAAHRRRPVRGDRLHHPRRAGAGGDRGPRTRHQADRDGVRSELQPHQPGRIEGAQGCRARPIVARGGGAGRAAC